MSPRPVGYGRRGSVLILVIGVLAMLFVIGTTQLMVARFEKQNAEKKASGSDLKGVVSMLFGPIAEMLQNDALAATNADLIPALQDSADFPGAAADLEGYVTWLINAGGPVPPGGWTEYRAWLELLRSGDSLLASNEPHWDPQLNAWRYFATSLGVDSFTQLIDLRTMAVNNSFQPRVTNGNPFIAGTIVHGDATGDGVTDSRRLEVALSSAFGDKYTMFKRVIGHGGMVMLDRMTHPALLAQVIHPRDAAHTAPMNIFSVWSRTTTDEARLRRREILPESTRYQDLPTNDLRRLLAHTLGYQSTSFPNLTPHWWPVGSDHTKTGDEAWWNARMRPMVALNENGYSVNNDDYDRRHLLTVYSYDDLLRPQRNESRLLRVPDPNIAGAYLPHPLFGQFFHVINPTPASQMVYNQFEGQGRFAYSADPLFGPPLAYGMMQTAQSTYSLMFNRPGLRTPFSLRDTLVVPASNVAVDVNGAALNWGYQASYRRAVQLTGYYLAMIQNTTVPGTARTDRPTDAELRMQFETALQLAVNTIDFADNADVDGDGLIGAGDIRWDTNGDGSIDVNDIAVDPITAITYNWMNETEPETFTAYGFEKQPFITEAYVKLMHRPVPPVPPDTHWTWEAMPDPTDSIYAVELYNPYMVDMRLDDFGLKLSPTIYADLANVVIPAQSWIVLANTARDVAREGIGLNQADEPFVPGARTSNPGKNLLVAGTDFEMLSRNATDSTTTPAGASDFKITAEGVSLVRKTVLHLEMNRYSGQPSYGQPVARLATVNANNRLGDCVVVDTLAPSSLGQNGNNLALDERFTADVRTTDVTATTDPARAVTNWNEKGEANDRLVSESSLQRRKDPANWQFTVGRQMVFPLPWHEHTEDLQTSVGSLPPAPFISDRPDSPPQHNLLGTRPYLNPLGLANQDLVGKYMDGVEVTLPLNVAPTAPYADGRQVHVVTDASQKLFYPIVAYSQTPAAPVHLVTSDLGLDAYGRCRAYPTTGTLLLVSRYAHIRQTEGVPDLPVSMALNLGLSFTNQRRLDYVETLQRTNDEQLIRVDHGHLPLFDPQQVVLGEPRRLQMPWGQLAFDYFTALPVEELFQVRDLLAIGGPAAARVVDLYNELNPLAFENAYKFVVNGLAPNFYGSSPVQDVVSTDGVRTIGPKVRGRVNVNLAPWWVLDGLPVLPDVYWDPSDSNYGLFASLPLPELVSTQLDAAGSSLAGPFMESYLMEPASAHNAGTATLNPILARYLVSYREKRLVEGQLTPLAGLPDDNYFASSPGYVGVGALCDVARRIPLSITYNGKAMPPNTPFGNMRRQLDPANPNTTGGKPFAYVGYLQMVAPMVRLQDWATVKSHVYTIHNLVGDTSEPPVWLRSQTTIDRTRCLYTNDLPDRIVQTEPISYFNAVSDQR